MKVFGGLFKRILSAGGTFFAGAEGREAIEELFKSDPVSLIGQIKMLKEKLEEAVTAKINKDHTERLVIFVDDLDRMKPGKAVELLEVLKNFLDINNCVFVLAVDYGVVSRGVKAKYGEDMDELKGRSFFDKIIQLPFNLPVAQYNIEKYLKFLFSLEGSEARIYKKLSENSVGTNPRALKRMANTMSLIELVATKKKETAIDNLQEFRRVLFASLCLQMAYEPVYSQILGMDMNDFFPQFDEDPKSALEQFKKAIEKCPGKNEATEERLKKFFTVLDNYMPMDGDVKDYSLFDKVLNLSGVTASGSLTTEEKESLKDSFDPLLMSQLKNVCAEIEKKYHSFWSMIEQAPTSSIEDGEICIPLIWGDDMAFIVSLGEDGISMAFYNWDEGDPVRGEYRQFIGSKFSPALNKLSMTRKKNGELVVLPPVAWKTDASIKGKDASGDRLQQLNDVLNRNCGIMLPEMEQLCKKSLPAMDAVQAFLQRIKEALEEIFPASNSWQINIGPRGTCNTPDSDIVTVTRSTWNESSYIYLAGDGGSGCSMYIGFRYESEVNAARETKSRRNIFNAFANTYEETGLSKPDDSNVLAVFSYLPEDLRDWCSGSVLEENMEYALTAKQEEKIISILQEGGKIFLSVEQDLDILAEAQK